MYTRAVQFVTLCIVILFLNNCVFSKLKEDLKLVEKNTGIGGEIKNRSPEGKSIIAILYTEVDGKKQIAGFKVIADKEGFYFFMVPIGEYYIIAFEDANTNFAYDAGEYFGLFGSPDPIRVASLTTIENLHITVDKTGSFPEGFPVDVSNLNAAGAIAGVANGTVITLADDRFSDEIAKIGFWQPITFMHHTSIGIYFLEEYDPAKTPILFVHGAAGTPRNFSDIVNSIDRNRYQPWFYHYPSGVPLERASRFLNRLIKILHKEYDFKELYLTAHSMGGLVSRSFIIKNVFEDHNDYVKLFVSISTPWGGLETAQKGVDSAPAVIPSWHDVVPNSPFIQAVFNQPLKPQVDYFLLFSFHGDSSMFMDNNDGTVTLRSQLDLRAQKDALQRWGFDEGHVTILSSPDVLAKYNEILEMTRSGGKGGFNWFGLTK